ncbi:hypothetical protein ACVGVM_16515 [Pseudonocardia bannensis]|uniref:Uncharacterized protein n=1 Tax=Pseudonocardia bannensis TaxID=630973 RepID=A0A848DS20_9PSEU|nr:hypothetical protein [Pseudonocardia bannensis]NMH95293.1 hypothetical protein [Pseudonocardia bannensis]
MAKMLDFSDFAEQRVELLPARTLMTALAPLGCRRHHHGGDTNTGGNGIVISGGTNTFNGDVSGQGGTGATYS